MFTVTEKEAVGTLTDRQAFRELVAQVAAKARAKLPETVNGRIESAVKLVLLHDVMPQADGSILVGSSRDPWQSYLLVGTACECQDFTRGQAPEGWCQHRIAAGIAKRVGELLPVQGDHNNLETPPLPSPAALASVQAAQEPGHQALPEAPSSCNVYLSISGHKVQVTLRDTDEQRMLARLQILLDTYPAPAPQGTHQLSPQQHNAAAMHTHVTGFCAVHSVQMTQNTKDGRTWWSHRTDDGQWCKGK